MKKIYVFIPARYGSTRFRGKPLALINGKPMIQWVYEKVDSIQLIDGLYVATDDSRIAECVNSFGGNVLMTSEKHASGSDRICECVYKLQLDDDDIVLNIQGDEPLIETNVIFDLIKTTKRKDFCMGTLVHKLNDMNDLENSNVVKVVKDVNDNAIYFSRSPIPYNREEDYNVTYYKHIGVYAYTVGFLKKFSLLDKSSLEIIEGLEQLRALENGYKISVAETESQSIGVDTPEQLKKVECILKGRG